MYVDRFVPPDYSDPTIPRETRILVLETDTGEYYIIASLSTRKDTQLISIDPVTGTLHFTNRPNIDVFPTELDALHSITSGSFSCVKSQINAKALIGYVVPVPNQALLLVATKIRTSVHPLPTGDTVQTISDSLWVKIPLRSPVPPSKFELKSASELAELSLGEVHYYCETRDISRPFPSTFPVHSPDPEFVWNQWLSSPFHAIGLPQHCIVLLQVRKDISQS